MASVRVADVLGVVVVEVGSGLVVGGLVLAVVVVVFVGTVVVVVIVVVVSLEVVVVATACKIHYCLAHLSIRKCSLVMQVIEI